MRTVTKISGNVIKNGIAFTTDKHKVEATLGEDGCVKVLPIELRESQIKKSTSMGSYNV